MTLPPFRKKTKMRGQNKLNKVRKLFLFQSCWWRSCGAPNVHFPKQNVLVLVSPLISISIRSSGKAASGVILGDKIQSWKINQAGNCFVSQKWTFPLLNLLNFVHLQFPIYFKSFAPHTHTHTEKEDEHTNIAPSSGGEREKVLSQTSGQETNGCSSHAGKVVLWRFAFNILCY